MTSIDYYAFAHCSSLREVKSKIINPFDLYGVFWKISSEAILYVPFGTKEKYQTYLEWTKYFKEIIEEVETYSISITVYGNGAVSYDGITIRNNTNTFTVNEGTSATITFYPDNGYRIKTVKLNNADVTSGVSNNLYTISNISDDTTLEVEFEMIPVTTYTLSIKASGNGTASYNGKTIRGKTSTFTVNDGVSATISFSPVTISKRIIVE